MKPLRYRAEAEAELQAAYDYYEERSPGLGERFMDAIERAVSEIQSAPRRHAPIAGDVRRKLVKPFPFALVYSDESDQVLVLAVMHLHREPEYWKSRHCRVISSRPG